MMEAVQCNQTSAILEAQYRSLLLADWALSSGHSQASLAEGNSMLLSSHTTSLSVILATLFMTPLGNDRGGWGKRQTTFILSICFISY